MNKLLIVQASDACQERRRSRCFALVGLPRRRIMQNKKIYIGREDVLKKIK